MYCQKYNNNGYYCTLLARCKNHKANSLCAYFILAITSKLQYKVTFSATATATFPKKSQNRFTHVLPVTSSSTKIIWDDSLTADINYLWVSDKNNNLENSTIKLQLIDATISQDISFLYS